MWEAILSTLGIMGWLGLVLLLLVIVNTVCGTIHNIHEGQEFSWKTMFKGLGKALVYYLSAVLTSIAFTMLPFINEEITNSFGIILVSSEALTTLSSVAVLGVVVATVIHQGKKALKGIVDLANISVTEDEIITWEVVDPYTNEPENIKEEASK